MKIGPNESDRANVTRLPGLGFRAYGLGFGVELRSKV